MPVHRIAVVVLALMVALSAAFAQAKPSAKAPAKKAASTAKKSTAKKSTAKKSTAKKQAATNPADARYRRSNQSQPTSERYAEIEQALQERGYLANSADGKWDKDSIDALKSFQRSQSLKDDGKLGALTLTALGLGPKRSTTVAQASPNSSPKQVE